MMRNTEAESLWESHTIIGYVPLDIDGLPYRAPRSGYGFQTQSQKGYHPPRVYQTMKKAASQSPVGSASEVRMFTQNFVDPKDLTEYN